MTDVRLQELTTWTNDLLDQLLESRQGPLELEPVSGDASFRRYFRARVGEDSYIAVDAHPDYEDNKTFVHLSNLLIAAGVSAPKVHSVDYDSGFMLLVDFGDHLYLSELRYFQNSGDMASVEELYSSAIGALIKIQRGLDKDRLPPFTVNRLNEEMQLFPRWFCEKFLAMELDSEAETLCCRTFDWLAEQMSNHPQLAVHRDFHSRNLMRLDPARFGYDCGPGVIDFQGAVSGSYVYDLASLLRDCYIAWPSQDVMAWASLYLVKAQASGLIKGITEKQLLEDMAIAGMQRHLKVLGIFARLSIRDNKSEYLADIPLVIRYFLDVSAEFEELAEFRAWFTEQVLPRAKEKLQLDI